MSEHQTEIAVQPQIVNSTEVVEAISKAEIDVQISTAKKYPRVIAEVLNNIRTYAMLDVETAQDCFYSVSRAGSTVEGMSVRFAEIVAGAWGNLRVATRIIGNDGKMITAQGIAHDLQTNVAVSVEVKRRITTKDGRTFSDDMQVVTGNAASAIAFRNAVLKVVPKAITKKITDEVKSVAIGSTKDLETRRKAAFEYAKKFGVTSEQILFYCHVKSVEEIDSKMLFDLRGAMNAINENSSTVEEMFVLPMQEAKKAELAAKKAEDAKGKADVAMAKTVK